ncbi:MAG: glycosyltransferase [Thermodesulfobacteriota bacterium]
MTNSIPLFSVVIPMHNSARTIRRCLDSLGALSHSSYEVILVDDGSTDETTAIARSYDAFRLIELPKGGPSRARNEGVRHAQGHLVAFTDSDCVVDEHWLTELEKGFIDQNVAGVGGAQRSPVDESEAGRTFQEFMQAIGFVTGYVQTGRVMKETNHNPSCNVAYKREVLGKVDGFDESLWPGEDVEIDLKIRRLGYKLIFNPAAMVGHYRPATYRDFAHMMERYGHCQGRLVRKYGPFRLLHYVPVGLVASVGILTGLLVVWPWAWPVLLIPPLGALLWFWLKTKRVQKALRFTRLLFLTFAIWHYGFAVGSIYPDVERA